MTQFGNWEYAAGTPRPGPSVVNVTSSSTQGSSATYTFTSSHTSGTPAIARIHLLIAGSILDGSSCHLYYMPGGTMNLVNGNADGVMPGTPGTIANSRCGINTGQVTWSIAGNNLTVTFPLTFQPSTFGGMKTVYANVFDPFGQLSHWVKVGTIDVR